MINIKMGMVLAGLALQLIRCNDGDLSRALLLSCAPSAPQFREWLTSQTREGVIHLFTERIFKNHLSFH